MSPFCCFLGEEVGGERSCFSFVDGPISCVTGEIVLRPNGLCFEFRVTIKKYQLTTKKKEPTRLLLFSVLNIRNICGGIFSINLYKSFGWDTVFLDKNYMNGF